MKESDHEAVVVAGSDTLLFGARVFIPGAVGLYKRTHRGNRVVLDHMDPPEARKLAAAIIEAADEAQPFYEAAQRKLAEGEPDG